jgi:hypothetical protein
MSTIRWSKTTTVRERERENKRKGKRDELQKRTKSMFKTNQSHIDVCRTTKRNMEKRNL